MAGSILKRSLYAAADFVAEKRSTASGLDEIHGASAEAAAGHARSVDAFDPDGALDAAKSISFAADFVIVLHGDVGLVEELAHAAEVGTFGGVDEELDSGVFADDVPGAAHHYGGHGCGFD